MLLAEVAFAEMTKEGSVRHAVFHGLRDDKPAEDITEERAESREDFSLENCVKNRRQKKQPLKSQPPKRKPPNLHRHKSAWARARCASPTRTG